jgi:soluble lytic murein transglycosylase
VQDRLDVPGQQCCGWLHVLLRIALVLIGIIPAVIQASPGSSSSETAQLPPSLQEWNQVHSFPLPDPLKSFKRGMDHYFGERYSAALEAFGDGPVTRSTALGDYILFYRAKSNQLLERNKEALVNFQRLENLYPDSPMVREALAGQCQLLLAMNEARAALSVLANPKIGNGPEITYYQAKALDMAGEKEKSAELFLRIYSRYPTSKYSSSAEQYFASSSPGTFKGARNYEARLLRAENLISSGDYRTARLILLPLGKVSAPSSAISGKRDLLFGEVEYRLGKATAAIPFFGKVAAVHPALHSKALYLEGVCLRKLDRAQAFLALRDKLLKLYPRSADAEELCYSAATYFDVNYDAARSREAYALLYESFPKGKYAERALWKMALFSYAEKKYGEAVQGFWKYLLAYPAPSSAGGAMYWMGRCYEKLSDAGAAEYLYRRVRALANDSYYGLRAQEAEISLEKKSNASRSPFPGIDFAELFRICDGIQLSPLEFAEPGPAAMLGIGRARQLMAAGFPDLALTELRWGRSQHPEDDESLSYVMSRIYAGGQDYDAAISSLRKAFPEYISRPQASLPEEIWETLFPLRHLELITEQSAKLKMDPSLVLGLIRQESAFNEQAHSKANARGLMQILPSTGRKLARQARVTRYSPNKLYQAETNIRLGTMYFSSFLQQYGKPELALAAYNAGDSRVQRWLREWGGLDMAEFVEQIPFGETRGYVKQVLSNRARYGRLIHPPVKRQNE